MVNPNQEMIWQGRVQLGDEPGIYGDAAYSGLCIDLPFTARRFPQSSGGGGIATGGGGTGNVRIVLETEEATTFDPYPGHEVIVFLYELDPAFPAPGPNDLQHSKATPIGRARLTTASNNRVEIPVDLSGKGEAVYLSLRICVDVTVTPGFYDDFIVRRLSLLPENFNYYASFGFQEP